MILAIWLPIQRESKRFSSLAVDGILDARDWDPETQGQMRLDGEWQFYWKQLLEPQDFRNTLNLDTGLLQVPSNWTFHKVNDENLEVLGYGTYRLTVKLPEDNQQKLAIRVGNVRNAHRLYVDDVLIHENGVVGNEKNNIIQDNTPYYESFQPQGSTVDITIQVASYDSYTSGINQSIHIGLVQDIRSLSIRYMSYDLALAGTFFAFGLFFFIFYIQRRSNREMLYFSLYCLSSLVYTLSASERMLEQLFPSISFSTNLTFLYLSSLCCNFFFIHYMYHVLVHVFPRKLVYAVDIFLVLNVILYFTLADFFPYLYIDVALVIVIFGFIGWYVFRAIQLRVSGVYYITITFLGILFLMLMTILNTVWYLETYFFLPFAQILVILSQALYMSQAFTTNYQLSESIKDKLTQLDKLKDDFLAKTSHELRTPLNGIVNISQSIMDGVTGPLSTSQFNELKLVRDLGKRLSFLINDILDFTKAKHDNLTLHLQQTDLHSVVEAVCNIFAYNLIDRPVQLIHHIEKSLFVLNADKNRMHQIVVNLVENALKYTRSGSVEITAYEHDGMVHVSVQDSGIGIAPEKITHIFTEYEQLDETSQETSTGLGLGLSITKKLVDLHGGSITAQSVVGTGTTISFSIPIWTEEAGGVVSPQSDVASQPLSKSSQLIVTSDDLLSILDRHMPSNRDQVQLQTHQGSILVVDDDPFNQRALRNVLHLEQYEVTCTSDGESALKLLANGVKYDVIILDIVMPGISGYEVTRQLRTKYSLVELPILLLSANANPQDIELGFSAGANDYLAKPFEASELKARVRTLTQFKKSTEELLSMQISLLQAQIKPHFISNMISTISYFCYHDPRKAAELLSSFSYFLRKSVTIKQMYRYFPFLDEMELVETYLSLEKARYGEKFQIELDIDEEAYHCFIPPLMVQPLIENAIHHGVMENEKAGRIKLTVRKEDQQLIVTLEDNGSGIPEGMQVVPSNLQMESNHIGLANIHQRLMYMTGKGLDIASHSSSGTRISFVIPQDKELTNT